MTDTVAITDEVVSVTLNDANTLWQSLADSLSIDDTTINVADQPVLTDTLAFTETIAFEYEYTITEAFALDDSYPQITGLLFGYEEITDSIAYSETVTEAERDSVYETGDYGSSAVFVITDVTNVGVFE